MYILTLNFSSTPFPHLPVRCIGDLVPAEPQEFQHSLPPSPSPGDLPNYVPIADAIKAHFADDSDHMASFIQLSYNCAATFRATDYRGGCNGARIRFPPESEWASNAELAVLIEHLEEIKTTGDFDVSMADMIVLSGILALEESNPDLDLPYVSFLIMDPIFFPCIPFSR